MSFAEDWGHDICDPEDFDREEITHEIQFTQLVHETHLAYLIKLDDNTQHWIPKSRSTMIDAGDVMGGTIEVSEWLLEKKGIEYGF